MIYESFSDFIKSKSVNTLNEATGGIRTNNDPRLVKAAEIIANVINKKTKGNYMKYAGDMIMLVDNQENAGIYYISDKNNTSFRVVANSSPNSPGIVGAIEFFEDFSRPTRTWELSSDLLPIVKLVNEAALLMSDKKYLAEVEGMMNESFELNESMDVTPAQLKTIEAMLAKGTSVAEIARQTGLKYRHVNKIKKGGNVEILDSPSVAKNEQTLNDKVLLLEEYMEDVYDITRKMAAGAPNMNSLLITGRAGTGKTYNVERALKTEGLEEGDDYVKISGAVSTIMMYKAMFQYRDKVIVFDDCDAVFSNEDGRNILKAALDTKQIRKISYMKKLKMLYDPKEYETNPQGELDEIESGNVPNQFDFSGRVIFISNLAKEKADPDGAIRSRSILIDINPDDDTLLERLKRLLPHMEPKDMPVEEKEEIFEFLNEAKDISMRTFVKAATLKASGLRNWKRITKNHL